MSDLGDSVGYMAVYHERSSGPLGAVAEDMAETVIANLQQRFPGEYSLEPVGLEEAQRIQATLGHSSSYRGIGSMLFERMK